MKFQPTKSRMMAGFWKPEPGDVLKGVIVESWESDYGPNLTVRLTAPCTLEHKNRETGAQEQIDAEEGDMAGVNVRPGLRGIEKYVGHEVTIRYVGKLPTEFGSRTIEMHTFDTDVSDKPVAAATDAPKAGAKKPPKGGAKKPGENDDFAF